ncbi:MAG: hypothetical protein L0G99_04830 [Propionibacteriales bacterium]|nr:hypothetical protein [Propionibacteriales bacterium]
MEIVSNVIAALSILGTILIGAMAILPSMLDLQSGSATARGGANATVPTDTHTLAS